MSKEQQNFDLTIGRLDRILSILVNHGQEVAKKRNNEGPEGIMDEPNRQTLKHHAEDMIAAGEKILKDLAIDQQSLPQPPSLDM